MDYPAAKRREMAGKGTAMPDGSFPIANARDLANAIQALGRAKDRAAARKHILSRARALGLLSKLPDSWSVKEARFDPHLHPRDRRGHWRDVLGIHVPKLADAPAARGMERPAHEHTTKMPGSNESVAAWKDRMAGGIAAYQDRERKIQAIIHGDHPVPVVPKHEPKQLPPGPPPPPRDPDTSYGQRRHADRSDPIISRLLDAVGSRVRHVTIIPSSRLEMQGSDWSEGQRHQYTMVRLSDMKTVQMPRASEVHGNSFNYNVPAPEVDIPDGFAVVDQQVGYKPYVYVYANPAGLTPMLSEGELDEDVALVLAHTARLKNTYGGETNIRFNSAKRNFGMTLSRWVAAQEKARSKGWLNKAGAITPSGRNAIEGHPLRNKVY